MVSGAFGVDRLEVRLDFVAEPRRLAAQITIGAVGADVVGARERAALAVEQAE